jgi:hypothetical protein
MNRSASLALSRWAIIQPFRQWVDLAIERDIEEQRAEAPDDGGEVSIDEAMSIGKTGPSLPDTVDPRGPRGSVSRRLTRTA